MAFIIAVLYVTILIGTFHLVIHSKELWNYNHPFFGNDGRKVYCVLMWIGVIIVVLVINFLCWRYFRTSLLMK